MVKLFIAQVVSLFCCSLAAGAATPTTGSSTSGLWDKVSVVRDSQGGLQELKIRGKASHTSFKSYVHGFLSQAQTLSAQRPNLERAMANVDLHVADQKALKASALDALNATDLASVEKNPQFRKLVKKLGVRFDATFMEQNILAKLDDSSFYFRATWQKDLMEWALSAIQLAGLDNTAINVIVYLFEKAVDDLFERREFYQNYALHFLTTTPSASLGLTDSEVSMILSSLYEARIEFYDLPASQRARADWPHFGEKSLVSDQNVCAQRLSDHLSDYESIGAPFDHIFAPTQTGQGPLVINLRDGMAFGNPQPSFAFDAMNPRDIRNTRIAFELFLLGVDLAPIPGPVAAIISWYVKSAYVPQVSSEGALMAYFQNSGDSTSAKIVIDQSVNPWLITD